MSLETFIIKHQSKSLIKELSTLKYKDLIYGISEAIDKVYHEDKDNYEYFKFLITIKQVLFVLWEAYDLEGYRQYKEDCK